MSSITVRKDPYKLYTGGKEHQLFDFDITIDRPKMKLCIKLTRRQAVELKGRLDAALNDVKETRLHDQESSIPV